jgi:hypothetical protein
MSDDAFVLLGLPPLPWLEPAEITAAFHQRARVQHPDAPSGGESEFAKLNAARKTLSDPAARLRLLVERNGGLPAAGARPSPAWTSAHGEDAFTLGPLLKRAASLAEGGVPTTQLQRAVRSAEVSGVLEKLRAAAATHELARHRLEVATRQCNDGAVPANEVLLDLAEQWTYAMRWRQQLVRAIRQCEDVLMEMTPPSA